jgi:hypothetical protein
VNRTDICIFPSKVRPTNVVPTQSSLRDRVLDPAVLLINIPTTVSRGGLLTGSISFTIIVYVCGHLEDGREERVLDCTMGSISILTLCDCDVMSDVKRDVKRKMSS